MTQSKHKARNSLIAALMVIMCLLLTGFYAYADAEDESSTLSVEAVWQEGETLNIDVFDAVANETFTIKVNLSEYTLDTEYLSIQAVSLDGEESKIVRVKNPYFATTGESIITGDTVTNSAIPSDIKKPIIEGNPFTPDGQAQLTDTATEEDGKEFFTITTANGDPFYLIIDKNRSSNNVYFLNTVTEQDLMALAEKNGTSIEVNEKPKVENPIADLLNPETEKAEPEKPEAAKKDYSIIFIIIGAAIFGVILYFVKIKPKRTMAAQIAEDEDFDDDDESIDMESSASADYEDEEYEVQPLQDEEDISQTDDQEFAEEYDEEEEYEEY